MPVRNLVRSLCCHSVLSALHYTLINLPAAVLHQETPLETDGFLHVELQIPPSKLMSLLRTAWISSSIACTSLLYAIGVASRLKALMRAIGTKEGCVGRRVYNLRLSAGAGRRCFRFQAAQAARETPRTQGNCFAVEIAHCKTATDSQSTAVPASVVRGIGESIS